MIDRGTMEVLDDALAILKALLQGEEVGKGNNAYLFNRYRHSSEVEDMLFHIAGRLELRVYSSQERLFVCPEAGSRLFGWSNEELRNRISWISSNSDLFTGYFIIMTLITMFYREAYPDTPVVYVKLSDLVETVNRRLEVLGEMEEVDTVSREHQFDFAEICRVWRRLPDAREGVSGGKNDKVNFVENICRFLQGERLIILDAQQRLIYPTERLKTIIWNYYEDRDNRRDLLTFVSLLGVSG